MTPFAARIFLGILFITGFAASTPAQKQAQSVKAVSVAFGGKIQLQKEGERVWKKINRKIRIEDGDLLKSGYKSYLIIRIGTVNQIILGSNSKMLIKLSKPGEAGAGVASTSITIFEGGCFVTWRGDDEVQFFSNDGMAATSKANFAFIYQKNDGKTHVISTNEKLMIQNITKKNPVEINKGEYTFLMPEKNPVEPTLITTEITDLMRKFFGDKFVNKELEQANIKVATTKTKAVAEKAETKQDLDQSIRITPLFNMGKIVKKIRHSDRTSKLNYREPYWNDEMQRHNYYFESRFSYLSTSPQGGSVSSFNGARVRAGATFGNLDVGVNVPFETNNEGDYTIAASSTQGLLDKIYYLNWHTPKESMSIHFGELRYLSFHEGLLVDQFSNELRSQIAQPLGTHFIWYPNNFMTWQSFVADLSQPEVIGTNFVYANGYTSMGSSLMFDLDQTGGLTTGDGDGNFRGEDEVTTDTASNTGTVWGWDIFIGFNILQQHQISVFGYAGLSQMLKHGFNSQGYAIQFPGFEIYYGSFKFFFEGLVSIDNSHPGYFNNFYLEDRSRITTVNGQTMSLSQADRHPPMGRSNGFEAGSEWRILKNLWIGLSYGQTLFIENLATLRGTDITRKGTGGGIILVEDTDIDLYKKNSFRSMQFRIFGGNNIVAGLKRFEVYYDVDQSRFGRETRSTPKSYLQDTIMVDFVGNLPERLNPIDTVLTSIGALDSLQVTYDYNNDYPLLSNNESESFFLSLSAMFGVKIEYGVLANASVLAEFRGFSHDFGGDGIYNEGDLVSEFSLTWRQKF